MPARGYSPLKSDEPIDMSTATQRAAEYRRRMRERGFRPVQMWVPDVRSRAFVAEAHRESLALAAVDARSDDMDFVEAISALADES
jgi:hypothetical protein